MRTERIAALVLAGLTALCCVSCDHQSVPVYVSSESEQPIATLYGLYDVVRVVDGDTIIVSIGGEDTRIRFIGVDTPESVNPDETLNTPQGTIAADFTKELLTGQQVYLEYDKERTDKYDRTLAYVYLADGETMVETELLNCGMARTMTIEPNTKYAVYFEQLEAAAAEKRIGIWSNE